MKEIASLIQTGAYDREVRRILRAIRLTLALRRKLKASVLSAFLNFALTPGSEAHSRLSSFIPKVIFYGMSQYSVFHVELLTCFLWHDGFDAFSNVNWERCVL